MGKDVAFFETKEASEAWAKEHDATARPIQLGNVWILLGSKKRKRTTVHPNSITNNLRRNARRTVKVF